MAEGKKINASSGKSLIPFIIFIAILLGSGIYFSAQGVDRPFY